MEGKIPDRSDVPVNWRMKETWAASVKRHTIGGLIWTLLAFLLAIMISVCQTSCATAPTPAFVPIEPWGGVDFKREILESGPGDDMPVEVKLGELRQAVFDSENLDGMIELANAMQGDLRTVIPEYNRAVEWIELELRLRRYRMGVVAGGFLAAFFGGIAIGAGL